MLHSYWHVTELHSRLPGWSPVHLYGGRAQGQRGSDHDWVCFELLGQAEHTQIALFHTQIITYIHTCRLFKLVHVCRPTCKPLDSDSLSAELPQGLEQDRQMDLPLANTEMHSEWVRPLSVVYNVSVNQYAIFNTQEDYRGRASDPLWQLKPLTLALWVKTILSSYFIGNVVQFLCRIKICKNVIKLWYRRNNFATNATRELILIYHLCFIS